MAGAQKDLLRGCILKDRDVRETSYKMISKEVDYSPSSFMKVSQVLFHIRWTAKELTDSMNVTQVASYKRPHVVDVLLCCM